MVGVPGRELALSPFGIVRMHLRQAGLPPQTAGTVLHHPGRDEPGDERRHHDAARIANHLQHVIGHVARVVEECGRAGMRAGHRRP